MLIRYDFWQDYNQSKQVNTFDGNDVVVKDLNETLTVDYETDVREGYDGPFSVLTQFPSKRPHKIAMKVIIKILFL